MSKKQYKKSIKSSKAEEPQTIYNPTDNTKAVHVFSSFAELEEDNYKWLASLTPEQHLQNATALIKRIFADDLAKHHHPGNVLYFD